MGIPDIRVRGGNINLITNEKSLKVEMEIRINGPVIEISSF
jgi:hypothetical protein